MDPRIMKALSEVRSTAESAPTTGNKSIQANINTMLKNKLKINLNSVPGTENNINNNANPNKMKIPLGELLISQGDQERVGFHDEFMSKLDEFSLSWRQEAMNQRHF